MKAIVTDEILVLTAGGTALLMPYVRWGLCSLERYRNSVFSQIPTSRWFKSIGHLDLRQA